MRVALIGGPWDGLHVDITETPSSIKIGRWTYYRIDDPGTGEFLGGYAICGHLP